MTTIEVTEENTAAGGDASFQAGVAAATAVNAAEDAQEAQDTAEGAQATAETAVDIAVGADSTAWAARADVDALGYELRERLDRIEQAMTGGGGEDGGGELVDADDDGTPPAPTPKEKSEPEEKPAEDAAEAPKAETKGYGSKRWFG